MLVFFFKKKISSILDPLINHFVWIAAHFTFLVVYICKYGISYWPFFFLFTLLLYLLSFYTILRPIESCYFTENSSLLLEGLYRKKKKIKRLYFLISILMLYSSIDFFKYAIESPNVASWFLYKFVDLQGRDPFLRILGTGISPFFYLFGFINIFIYKESIKLSSFFLFLSVMIQLFAGGRSAFLHFLFSLGAFVLYFNSSFSKSFVSRLNKIGAWFIGVSIILASIVSSFYSESLTFMDGFRIIINRLVAAADGLEYYMNYNGEAKLPTGLWQYFLSIFGVYVKGILGIDYKNVGTQLTELVVGEVDFAQGANYTIFLQTVVFGSFFCILYIPILSFLSAKLRDNRTKSVKKMALSYFYFTTAFTCITDIEYFTLVLISGVICYYAFVWPYFTFTIKHKT